MARCPRKAFNFLLVLLQKGRANGGHFGWSSSLHGMCLALDKKVGYVDANMVNCYLAQHCVISYRNAEIAIRWWLKSEGLLQSPGGSVILQMHNHCSNLQRMCWPLQVKGLDTENLIISHIQVNQAQRQRRRTYRAHGRINRAHLSGP